MTTMHVLLWECKILGPGIIIFFVGGGGGAIWHVLCKACVEVTNLYLSFEGLVSGISYLASWKELAAGRTGCPI